MAGLSHHSAPVALLERAAVAAQEVPAVLDEMTRGRHVSEAMLLSTCNRVEVYAVVDAFHGGLTEVSTVLGRHAGLPLPALSEHLYVHYAGSAVQHLFAVAAGLDSMVVGEAQILGQLRAGQAGGHLGDVVEHLPDLVDRLRDVEAALDQHQLSLFAGFLANASRQPTQQK